MLRSLIKIGLLLVAGILVYNYFFGTEEEKQQSKEIFTGVKDLTKSAVGLLKSEKEKFEEGKYDEALDKIGGLIDNLKEKAKMLEDNRELLDEIRELEDERRALSEQVEEEQLPEQYNNTAAEEQPPMEEGKRRAIEQDWERLVRKTEDVVKKMEEKEQ